MRVDILGMHTVDIELKSEAVRLMRESGSLKYTVDVCRVLDNSCRKELFNTGGNEKLIWILDLFVIDHQEDRKTTC